LVEASEVDIVEILIISYVYGCFVVEVFGTISDYIGLHELNVYFHWLHKFNSRVCWIWSY